ncbi:MAG: 8-amino-7-oxononanoate synthase [Desulfomonile tiedjei]|nr:8-amino-7-oxononanoate synthase [Desulfomonile tiedjei]
MNKTAKNHWGPEIEKLRFQGLYRTMPSVAGLPGRVITVNGKDVVNFSGNNYLGLAGHPEVVRAAKASVEHYGAGATASRLIAGNTELHLELETFIAAWKGTEAAVVFGSGYQANVGILSALADKEDLIISDQYNHASIIDGCRLSRAKVMIYPHLDVDRVEQFLKLNGFRRKLVVTESVFSMDGDRAPLRQIDDLCKRWGAVLMVDEAHATGVLGPQGKGLAAEVGVVPEIQMGTLGKAVGSAGAYVAGSRGLVDLVINRARSLIYTTAGPPGVIGASLAALKIVASQEGNRRRKSLKENTILFQGLLERELGFSAEASHIVPIVIGDSRRTMEVSAACLSVGIFAHGIRYPTVPEGAARLRFTLMSEHTAQDLNKAVAVMAASMSAVNEEQDARVASVKSR